MRNSVLTALFALAMLTAAHAAEPECDHSESRTTPSPDGRWIASVQEEACTTSTGGAAAAVTVTLAAAGDPEHHHRVFSIAVPRSRDDWPRIRWDGAAAMQIRVPNLSEPGTPEPDYNGIHISLAYCGDNPADRQRLADYKAAVKQWQKDVTAWVQKRKQDPDAAGPRPDRPEEPQLAAGHCTD